MSGKKGKGSRADSFFELSRLQNDEPSPLESGEDDLASSSRAHPAPADLVPLDATQEQQRSERGERDEEPPPLERLDLLGGSGGHAAEPTEAVTHIGGLEGAGRGALDDAVSPIDPTGAYERDTEGLEEASGADEEVDRLERLSRSGPIATSEADEAPVDLTDTNLSPLATLDEPAAPAERKAAKAEAPLPPRTVVAEREARRERLKARLEEDPDDADTLIRLATLSQEMGSADEAVAYLRRAVRIEPDNAFVRKKLLELGDSMAVPKMKAVGEQIRALVDGIFGYPLRGRGGIRTIGPGALLCGLALAATSLHALLGLVLLAPLAVLLFSYQHKVVRASAAAETAPPEWPDAEAMGRTFGSMTATFLACFLLPALLLVAGALSSRALAPETGPDAVTAGVYAERLHRMTHHFMEEEGLARPEAEEAAQVELMALGIGAPPAFAGAAGEEPLTRGFFALGGLLALIGLFYYPMALLLTTQFDSARPASNYVFGLAQTARCMPHYLVVAGLSAAVVVAAGAVWYLSGALLERAWAHSVIGVVLRSTLTAFVGLYLFLVMSHAAGRLYCICERRLHWFRWRPNP